MADGVKVLGEYAFEGCSNLESVVMSKKVEFIGRDAFGWCEALKTVVLPNSIKEMEDDIFFCCENLESATLPKTIAKIPEGLFKGCSRLRSIAIPSSVVEIGTYAFDCCEQLADIQIPNKVVSIGEGAFDYCKSLTDITLPADLVALGDSAFEGCSSLQTATFAGTVKKLGEEIFEECASLQTIYVPAKKTAYYKNRIDEQYRDIIIETGKTLKKKIVKEEPMLLNTFATGGGPVTVKVGDIFYSGEMYLDNDTYTAHFRFFTSSAYKVSAVYTNYIEIEYDHPDKPLLKLYPNAENEYFTMLPPLKFNKQWKYDPYYPQYYILDDAEHSEDISSC
jgi:hypothetical protein